ncbi:phospholipase D-like domain-containing protein [Solirhodobacter olei]|uniref:phospholipase D-like domain-containing protein n=1 Tax=Solirhodobacter olei TaxID=2493082 RepID=UPI000FDC6BCE|nr:phospholipase D-like domain-containing protein [Solirhodobacter olei]
MHLVMGGINGHYLRDIRDRAAKETDEVLAAVAYATDMSLLFKWCLDYSIPLRYYGRLDDGVAVTWNILRQFLEQRSAKFQCWLVQHHHAKVIWWRGHGLYVGSANLTGSAWYSNIESGCFFEENEITDEIANDVLDLFETLHAHATPLTEELLTIMKDREKELGKRKPPEDEFWKSASFNTWPGLIQTQRKAASDRRRQAFLAEWHSTLQQLRDIGTLVSRPENRPSWIKKEAPAGALADQFLHAHYYQRTMDGRRARYEEFYEKNKNDPDAALREAVAWWRNLRSAPSEEDEMLNITAPKLRSALSKENLKTLDENGFRMICMGVHAIKDYARRVANKSVGLPESKIPYTIPQKVDALSARIWRERSEGGTDVRQLLAHILYGGPNDKLPERLWQGFSDPRWKLEGLGISALGELVGWALPDAFPPRNGRTSKSLRSLGNDVRVHVG